MHDAIVVGSGAGGAWVAKELAEAGRDVLLIEEGGHHPPSGFNGRPSEMMPLLYRDAGLTGTVGNVVIPVPVGRGVGGTTVVNMGTCFRPRPERLRSWGLSDGELDTHFDAVESFLHVEEVSEERLGGNGRTLQTGLRRLGIEASPVRRNARHDHSCGICFLGCPPGTKQSMDVSAVPAAVAAGATLLAETRVVRILHRGRRVRGVRVEDRDGQRDIEAKVVFVAAGALHTPFLLRKSGIRAPGLGRHLHLHPATRVAGLFREEIRPWEGVGQSLYAEAGDGVLLEATVSHPAVEAMALPLQGETLEDTVADWSRVATCGVAVGDESSGRVLAWGRQPLLWYRLRDADRDRLVRGIRLAGKALLAAGALRVHLPVRASPPVQDEKGLEEALVRVRSRDLLLEAFHPMSTAGMGRTVDGDGRVKGYIGLYVADASVLPTSLDGRNPQITIMAFARRIAHRHLESRP